MKFGKGDAHRNPTNGDEVLITVACWVTARGWVRGSLPGSRRARLTQPRTDNPRSWRHSKVESGENTYVVGEP